MELFRQKISPNQPNIATEEHLTARFEEWRKNQKVFFSTATSPWMNSETENTSGYAPIQIGSFVYYIRQTAENFTETIRLDQHGRKIEYWTNWDRPGKTLTRHVYDDEGFVTNIMHLKGSGYGHETQIHYQKDDNGRYIYHPEGVRIPESLIIQHFFGNPTRSWEPRKISRGNNEGNPVVIDLLDIQL